MENFHRATAVIVAKFGFGILTLSFLVGVASTTYAPMRQDAISTQDFDQVLGDINLETARDPITLEGRRDMQNFINKRFASIAKASTYPQSFETKVFMSSSNDVRNVVGTNYMLFFQAFNVTTSAPILEKDDEPLLILANYDTEETEPNPFDDNGSGIMALVTLAQHFAHQIASKRLRLDRSLIFAATDCALRKYDSTAMPTKHNQTGTDVLIKQWLLPKRRIWKGFKGAIVLDSIMNYDDLEGSQKFLPSDGQFSKAFPLAHKKMAESKFRGDFLAIVQRESSADSVLAQAFERGWKKSGTNSDSKISPSSFSLIPFIYTKTTFSTQSDAAMHFVKSEQSSFWAFDGEQFPAILLTDTEKYRDSCTRTICSKEAMTTPKNLEFLKKTVNALEKTIKELQIDSFRHNGAVKLEKTVLHFLITLMGIFIHHSVVKIVMK